MFFVKVDETNQKILSRTKSIVSSLSECCGEHVNPSPLKLGHYLGYSPMSIKRDYTLARREIRALWWWFAHWNNYRSWKTFKVLAKVWVPFAQNGLDTPKVWHKVIAKQYDAWKMVRAHIAKSVANANQSNRTITTNWIGKHLMLYARQQSQTYCI